jgi:1-aminocyclopropane-1-carboxylate deaminase/D-cysteine desulfhydrase-like pyridoxal-dependent ACC family enzyme
VLPTAVLERFPALAERLRVASLGVWPTPVEPLVELARELGRPSAALFVKRDDRSSPVYGGNKVRTLDVLFGEALAQGLPRVVATGAYGSNHALATVLHAPRVGLVPDVALFPQPATRASAQALAATLAHAAHVTDVFHWATLPFRIAALALRARRPGDRALVMMPGGATPLGALGYVLAAFELAEQVRSGAMPEPRTVFVGVGSNATSAGLLLGFVLAARAGVGFTRAPELVAVRVTPWPVTSRLRILGLAARTSRLLAERAGDPSAVVEARELAPSLRVDGRQLGRGYAHPTKDGLSAIELFGRLGLFELDTTYSAKAVSAFLAAARRDELGPLLYWSTRSTAPLPPVPAGALDRAPRRMHHWLDQAAEKFALEA